VETGPDVTQKLSIVMPVRNESDGIRAMLESLRGSFDAPTEILVIYDDDSDSTLPVVRAMTPSPDFEYRLIKNTFGRGPANALKAGFAAAVGDAIIVMMADRSDDLRALTPMLTLFDRGYDLVTGSRYMAGGEQVGGPWLKGKLSRAAGLSLNFIGLPIHDPTNSFKLYRTTRLRELSLEGGGGFEINLEIVTKAIRAGWQIGEVPSRWIDRTTGNSNFQLWRWLPRYLKWYRRAAAALLIGKLRRRDSYRRSSDVDTKGVKS
jgi:dolichol-phosphate mannosyltransferase